jgi:hypothetical protein
MVTKTIRIQEGVAFTTPKAVFVPCLTNGFDLDIEFSMGVAFYYETTHLLREVDSLRAFGTVRRL